MRNRNMGISDKYQRGIAIRRRLGAALYYPLFDDASVVNPLPAIGTLPATGVGGVGFGASQHPWLPNMRPAAYFNGLNNYISLSQSVGSEYITSAFVGLGLTTEAWVRTSQIDGNSRMVFVAGNLEGVDRFNRWSISATGSLVTRVASSQADTGVVIADGKWHHIATCYNVASGTAKTYLDGSSIHTFSGLVKANFFLPWRGLSIGATPTGTQLFRGDICHVTIYPRELTAADVQYLYTLGTSVDLRGRPWFGQRM